MNNCAFIPRAIQENNDKALFESCVNLSSYFLFLSPFILEGIVKTKTVSPRILCPNNRSFLASRMESEYRYIYISILKVFGGIYLEKGERRVVADDEAENKDSFNRECQFFFPCFVDVD